MADTSSDGMDPILNLLNERPRQDWEWRFEPDTAGLSAVNAVALANAALLAYSDWDGIQHYLEKWRLSDALLLSSGEAQGYVARQDETVFVAFRGTEPLKLAQLPKGLLTSDELAWQEREVIYSGTLADLIRDGPALFQAELAESLRQPDRILDHDPVRGYLPKSERNCAENLPLKAETP